MTAHPLFFANPSYTGATTANGLQQKQDERRHGPAATIEEHVELVAVEPDRRIWLTTTTIVCGARRHGTVSAYKNAGCRCPGASDLVVRYEKTRRIGRVLANVDATGSARRLQALAALGWGSNHLAEKIGRSSVSLSQLRRGCFAVTSGATAAAVARVYAELASTPGPSDRTRRFADRYGYTPPEAWTEATIDDPSAQPWSWDSTTSCPNGTCVDEVAVERALRGERVELTIPERTEAIRRLLGRGESVTSVAHHLHMSNARVRELLQREEGAA